MNDFERSLRAGDLTAADRWATPAFEMMRGDTLHCVVQRTWVKKLIEVGRLELADATTLSYLEFLKSCGQSSVSAQNRILFWAAPLQEHRSVLPRSIFRCEFP